MTKLPYLPETSALPGAHDPGRAEPWMERWRAAAATAADPALHEFAQRLAQDPRGQRLLQAIFANSPFLSHCSIADIGLLPEVLKQGTQAVLEKVIGEIKTTAAVKALNTHLMKQLTGCPRQDPTGDTHPE